MLKKSIYELKQSPRVWYSKLRSKLIEQGFKRCTTDYSLFTKTEHKDIIVVVVYVDDIIIAGRCKSMIDKAKNTLTKYFDMKDLGEHQYFWG